jgi:hypothetical protein
MKCLRSFFLQEAGKAVNAAKQQIDALGAALGNKRAESPSRQQDPEEFKLLQVCACLVELLDARCVMNYVT